MTQILGIASTVFIIGFLIFGVRQGLRQRAAAKRDRGPAGPPGDTR
jgi:hypothetical protein